MNYPLSYRLKNKSKNNNKTKTTKTTTKPLYRIIWNNLFTFYHLETCLETKRIVGGQEKTVGH